MRYTILNIAFFAILMSCTNGAENKASKKEKATVGKNIVQPKYITEPTEFDTDDPAIWINPNKLSESFIIGTDKETNGGIYAYDLQGKIITDKVIKPMQRPNNVDVEYGFVMADDTFDIAVVAERLSHKIRIYRLPEMTAIDNGGIEVFVGETQEEYRDLMGISCYKNPASGAISVIVGRKNGPTDGTYLWQYQLFADTVNASIDGKLLRKFGNFSGKKEIEAIAVDDELGYVYYSDEQVGIRQYYANPDMGNEELAFFAKGMFADDNEGIAIYKTSSTEGYIIYSDQGVRKLQVYSREGTAEKPYEHKYIGYVTYAALETDGIEITNLALNDDFPKGLLVAMSDDKTFHLYSMEDILNAIVKE